jgi:flavorubredoxin
MDKKMQYDFYRLSVRKKKRYAAWLKKETEENIAIIKQVYGYTEDKANQVLNILGPKDLDVLKQSLQTGGIDNKG